MPLPPPVKTFSVPVAIQTMIQWKTHSRMLVYPGHALWPIAGVMIIGIRDIAAPINDPTCGVFKEGMRYVSGKGHVILISDLPRDRDYKMELSGCECSRSSKHGGSDISVVSDTMVNPYFCGHVQRYCKHFG